MRVAELSVQAAELASSIAGIGNINAVTDAAAGVLMAQAAVQIAGLNVKINIANLKDQELAAEYRTKIISLEEDVRWIAETTNITAAQRGGF